MPMPPPPPPPPVLPDPDGYIACDKLCDSRAGTDDVHMSDTDDDNQQDDLREKGHLYHSDDDYSRGETYSYSGSTTGYSGDYEYESDIGGTANTHKRDVSIGPRVSLRSVEDGRSTSSKGIERSSGEDEREDRKLNDTEYSTDLSDSDVPQRASNFFDTQLTNILRIISTESDADDDEGDNNNESRTVSKEPTCIDAATVRMPSAMAVSVGYEASPNGRGGVDVVATTMYGEEKCYENDEEETLKCLPSSTRCCTRRMALLSLLFISGVAALAAGLGYYFLAQNSDTSGNDTSSTTSSSSINMGSTSEDDELRAVLMPTAEPNFLNPTAEPKSLNPTILPTTMPSPHPTALPTSGPTTEAERLYSTFSFVVMGDIPYSDDEAAVLEGQLYQLGIDQDGNPKADGLFAVHVGDIMGGSDSRSNECDRSEYRAVEEMLTKKSPIPVLMLPGDNDWTECADPDEGWKYWERSFNLVEWSWAAAQNASRAQVELSRIGNTAAASLSSPFDFSGMVERQAKRMENFAFIHENVLFLGVNTVSDVYSRSELRNRMEDNIEWVREQLGMRRTTKLRAVIIFGHAWHGDFFDDLEDDLMSGLDYIPVIYFHGDGHVWYVDQSVYGDENPFWVMQVDQGAEAPPLKVTVYGDDAIFLDEDARKEANDELFDGFIGVDRRGGRDNGPQIYIGVGSTSLIALGDEACRGSTQCGRCEGDCDSDDACLPGLKCMQRDGFEPVPGCDGSGGEGWDYCYDPSLA